MEDESIERGVSSLNETIRSLPVITSEFFAKRYLKIENNQVDIFKECFPSIATPVSNILQYANSFGSSYYEKMINNEIDRIVDRAKVIRNRSCRESDLKLSYLNKKHSFFISVNENIKKYKEKCTPARQRYVKELAKLKFSEDRQYELLEKKLPEIKKTIRKYLGNVNKWFEKQTPKFINDKNKAIFKDFYDELNNGKLLEKFKKDSKSMMKYIKKYMDNRNLKLGNITPEEVSKIPTFFKLEKLKTKYKDQYKAQLKLVNKKSFVRLRDAKARNSLEEKMFKTYYSDIVLKAKSANTYTEWMKLYRKGYNPAVKLTTSESQKLKELTNTVMTKKKQLSKAPLPLFDNIDVEKMKLFEKTLAKNKSNPIAFLKNYPESKWAAQFSNIVKDNGVGRIQDKLQLFKCKAIDKLFNQKDYNGCMLLKNKVITILALKKMMKTKNTTAMKKYLETVKCERNSF
jgi:hypothetical protein